MVHNYVPPLGQDFAFPALDASADEATLEMSADDLLIMPEGHDKQDGDGPSIVQDLTYLRKRLDCHACQPKVEMCPAKRKNPLLPETSSGWAHTLLDEHFSSSEIRKSKNRASRCSCCFFVLERSSGMSFL